MERRNPLLWLVAMGLFMETLDATIVNTALPAMAFSLGESPLAMHSVVVAYSLTIAILIPASGWIADRFGTRRTFLWAILVFTIGSLCCAVSQSLGQLVVARVLQGMGGSMLLPVGRLSVLRTFPGKQYLPAISFVSVPGLLGPLLGPTLGGWLVNVASWHWIFLINLPVGIVGYFATLKYMPNTQGGQRERFDITGYGMLAIGMLTLSVSLDGLSEAGGGSPSVRLLAIFGLASFAAFGIHAQRHAAPLFSPRLLKIPTFTIGLLGNFFARLGVGAMPFLLPLFLQLGLMFTPLQAGLMMLPTALGAIAIKRFASPLVQRYGYRKVLIGNTLVVGLSIASFALSSPGEPIWLQVLQCTLFGAVNSLQLTTMNSLTLLDLDLSNSAGGNSLFSTVQLLSMSLGVAIGGALLNSFTRQFGTSYQSLDILDAFHLTFGSVGFVTCTSAWIFWQLERGKRRKEKLQASPLH